MNDLNQIEMISLDPLVEQNHLYRQLLAIVNFEKRCGPHQLPRQRQSIWANGYGIVTLFQFLLLLFIEDISA